MKVCSSARQIGRFALLTALANLGMIDPVWSAQTANAEVTVCFSPPDDCASLVAQAIDAAKTKIRVLAYELTDRAIIGALVNAHYRGVDVEAVLDPTNQQTPKGGPGSAYRLSSAGIPVWIDHPRGIEHNKTIVIDNDIVIGGSFNYTYSAQHFNAENLTLIHSAAIASWYLTNWDARMTVSERFKPVTE
jgi:phosphatidylserine/phosphatidylglycerophosphate/cardiolipin synthase-like enzyme